MNIAEVNTPARYVRRESKRDGADIQIPLPLAAVITRLIVYLGVVRRLRPRALGAGTTPAVIFLEVIIFVVVVNRHHYLL